MADPLSMAASIIALIQLTGALSAFGHGYIGGLRRGSADRRRLVEEFASLNIILQHLRDHSASTSGGGGDTGALQDLAGPLANCRQELDALAAKMKPRKRKGLSGIWRTLKWPLEEAETLQAVERIERYKTLFHFAVTADHSTLLRTIEQTGADTTVAIQGLQRDITVEAAAQELWRQRDRDKNIAKKRKTVLAWLLPGAFEDIHADISKARQNGTGTWLLEALDGLRWEQGDVLLVWGHGIAGAGKTFLSSRIIDHLRSKASAANYGVIHVYFDYNEQNRQTPAHVFASLVKQLATQVSGALHPRLERLYDALDSGIGRPSVEQLYAALRAMARSSFARVFCVLDALDECHPENQRRELLPLIRRMAHDGFGVFVTSRPYPEDVAVSFHDAPKIELLATKDDMKRYIEEKFNENHRLKLLIQVPQRKEWIVSELADCAGGMFLLVRYHIEYLRQQVTLKKILTELDKLRSSSRAKSLDPTYDRALETLRGQHPDRVDLATRVLSWLLKARRTLSVRELQIAVAVEQGRYELDELDLPEPETLLDVCAGLVTIDAGSRTIRLAHLTVQEYLQNHAAAVIPAHAEFAIAIACVTCVSFEAAETSVAAPFMEYAREHAVPHLAACDGDVSTRLILAALNDAVTAGREAIVEVLLERLADPAALLSMGDTTLHWAAARGFGAVVALLLDRGADLAALDGAGRTVLYRAAAGGSGDMVAMLLAHGAEMADVDADGETALWRAVREGNEDAVELLLEHGADTTQPDSHGNTVLYRAATDGHERVAELLLAHGARITALDEHDVTALNRAAHEGNEGVVKLLLARGTDPAVRNRKGETALHLAAFNGNEGVVSLILAQRIDLEIRNRRGETALHQAALAGNDRVVKLLLECGADVAAVDDAAASALDRAAHEGNEAVVGLLLDHGADIAATDAEGDTLLHRMAFKGNEGMVKVLLDHGAVGTARNNFDRTPLYCAVEEGHMGAIEVLLTHGGDLAAVDPGGDTLRLAATTGDEEIAALLLKHGADTSACLRYGRTNLYCAVEAGHEGMVRLLLKHGADLQGAGKSGQTALHIAAVGGSAAMVGLLLDHGADVTAQNSHGHTPMYHAMEEGHGELVSLLLERGAKAEAGAGAGAGAGVEVHGGTEPAASKAAGAAWARPTVAPGGLSDIARLLRDRRPATADGRNGL